MADRVISRDEGVPSTFGTLYKDIGSGAYAPVVATVAAGVSPVPSAITPTHTIASVNGNTLALAANDARVYALLINDSDTVIYLNFGGAAAVNTGIRLNASGGSYEMSPAFRNMYLGAIYTDASGKFSGVGDPVNVNQDIVNFDTHIQVDMLGSSSEYQK